MIVEELDKLEVDIDGDGLLLDSPFIFPLPLPLPLPLRNNLILPSDPFFFTNKSETLRSLFRLNELSLDNPPFGDPEPEAIAMPPPRAE